MADGKPCGPHWRLPWQPESEPDTILVNARLDAIKGTYRAKRQDSARWQALYRRAKLEYDDHAANDIVDRWVNHRVMDTVVDAVVRMGKPALVVYPSPEFDPDTPSPRIYPPKNALPVSFAAYIASELGGSLDHEIVEFARPGRTKLQRLERFLWQPAFKGPVSADHAYVLVDDNCSSGGTFAALRSHIVGNGGQIAAVTSLARSDGKDCKLSIGEATLKSILEAFGHKMRDLWLEEIGHDITHLTEVEGSYLVDFADQNRGGAGLFERFRDRLAQAAAQGMERRRNEEAQGTRPQAEPKD